MHDRLHEIKSGVPDFQPDTADHGEPTFNALGIKIGMEMDRLNAKTCTSTDVIKRKSLL
jgi:hypothetical protein